MGSSVPGFAEDQKVKAKAALAGKEPGALSSVSEAEQTSARLV